MTRTNEKIEVLTVTEQRRRRWSTQEKAELVRLTYEPGMSVSLVARQHCVAASQLFNWRKLDREGVIDPDSDALLAEAVRAEIAALPTYGYRRAGALANRTRSHIGLAAVNHKRYYRVMKQYGLLLPKAPKRRVSSRPHEGKEAVTEFNRRSCSDGFEIACDNGQVVTGTFTKDCCDREIIAWRAWSGRGLPGEPVREMLIEAVEKRFGDVDARTDTLEFLSDNGGAYRAHETHAIAKQLGLTPIHTPVCSPQSNGMAESFVNTLKRDYVSQMDCSTAAAVLSQLPDVFEHFNEVHPHSALKWKSPRMYRRKLVRQA